MRSDQHNPNADVLTEIADQSVDDIRAGGQGWTTTVTTISCYGVSWAVGNDGNFCTATVECQKNCN